MASVIRKPLTRFHRLASLGSKHAVVSMFTPSTTKRKVGDIFDNLDAVYSKRPRTSRADISIPRNLGSTSPIKPCHAANVESTNGRYHGGSRSDRPKQMVAGSVHRPATRKASAQQASAQKTSAQKTSVPFSLEAALKGTIRRYGQNANKPYPNDALSFDIHYDTPEEEMANLLQHSTATLDITPEEDKRSREQAEGHGKENVPPIDDVSQILTRRSAGLGKAIGKGRLPLGKKNTGRFYFGLRRVIRRNHSLRYMSRCNSRRRWGHLNEKLCI